MDDDLFSAAIKYLNIIYKGKRFTGKWEDIFCSPDYAEFDGITYVSSPGFFFKFVKDFKQVELIIGIDKGEPSAKFDPIEGAEFFKSLDKDVQERVANGNINIRYAKDKIIHSKLYLLRDSKSQVARVIIGSANFTQSALYGKNQFEELIVYDRSDNPDICDVYEERYKEIYQNTIDYIPQRIKEKFKMGLPIIIDEETAINIVQEDAVNLKASDADFIQSSIEEEGKEIEYRVKEVENKRQFFKVLTKKTDNKYEFKPIRNGLNKEIKDVIVKRYVNTKHVTSDHAELNEKNLFYNEDEHSLIVQNKDGSTTPVSQQLDKERLTQGINKLDKIIGAYAQFVQGNDEEKIKNKKRIFEIILYAFISPFIWKLRKEYAEIKKGKEAKADVSVFLIISGASKTGKTSLLNMINILLGNYREIENYSSDIGYKIKNRLHFEDLYPVLVDEVPKKYFSKGGSIDKGRGSEFIIQTGNTLGDLDSGKQKYPAVIITTNEDVDNIQERLLRRMYNIKLERQFDNDKKAAAENYKNDIIDELNNDLFKDFSWRMLQKIKEGAIDFKLEGNDFLRCGRGIFKDWFNEIGKQPFDWYNENRLDGYYERGSKKWSDLYFLHKEEFKERDNHTILLNTDKVFLHRSDLKPYIEYLASGILKDGNEKAPLLDKKEFFKFIGLSNTGNRDGAFKKLWGKLKRT